MVRRRRVGAVLVVLGLLLLVDPSAIPGMTVPRAASPISAMPHMAP